MEYNKYLKFAFPALLIFLLAASAQAQLATWDFAGTDGASSVNANSSESGLSASAAEVGPGLTAASYRDGGGLTANDQTQTSISGAKSVLRPIL